MPHRRRQSIFQAAKRAFNAAQKNSRPIMPTQNRSGR